MPAPNHGFAFMRTSRSLARAYDRSPVARALASDLACLRAALPNVNPENYRGIGRYPLNADYNYNDPGWQWERERTGLAEELGVLAVEEALGMKPGVWPEDEWLIDKPWLLPDLPGAMHVRSFLEDAAAFDLIEVALYPFRTSRPSIGFDVGWWGSSNFSIICDAVVWPIWHPPPAEAVPALVDALSDLNDAVLFADPRAAERYREVYRTQAWAEDEPPPFDLIEVALVNLDARDVR